MEVKGLKKYFPNRKGFFNKIVSFNRGVNGVDFTIKKGESVGLVGESGSGKTTLGRCIVRLYEPTEGSVEFNINGQMIDLTKVPKKEMKSIRKHFQMLFQDVYSSLDSRMKVVDIVTEPMAIHKIGNQKERIDRAKELMERVGLSANDIRKYPHQFSGGQRQRIGITRALSINPDFIVCDEPVSALDVAIQAQVLNLLCKLQDELDLTYLFISHDLAVIQHVCDEIAVMYLGTIVEKTNRRQLFNEPRHPYTKALLSAVLQNQESKRTERIRLEGDIPNPINKPTGCRFHTRCRYAEDVCRSVEPELTEKYPGHWEACHFETA